MKVVRMINGNQSWQNALSQASKQPLYVFEIPEFGLLLASFVPSQTGVTLGGYGMTTYGVGGYGT